MASHAWPLQLGLNNRIVITTLQIHYSIYYRAPFSINSIPYKMIRNVSNLLLTFCSQQKPSIKLTASCCVCVFLSMSLSVCVGVFVSVPVFGGFCVAHSCLSPFGSLWMSVFLCFCVLAIPITLNSSCRKVTQATVQREPIRNIATLEGIWSQHQTMPCYVYYLNLEPTQKRKTMHKTVCRHRKSWEKKWFSHLRFDLLPHAFRRLRQTEKPIGSTCPGSAASSKRGHPKPGGHRFFRKNLLPWAFASFQYSLDRARDDLGPLGSFKGPLSPLLSTGGFTWQKRGGNCFSNKTVPMVIFGYLDSINSMHTAFNRFQHCCSLRTITSTTYHQVVGFVPTWRTCKWPLRGSCTDAKDAERNLKGEKWENVECIWIPKHLRILQHSLFSSQARNLHRLKLCKPPLRVGVQNKYLHSWQFAPVDKTLYACLDK